jgi:hypothetical protein
MLNHRIIIYSLTQSLLMNKKQIIRKIKLLLLKIKIIYKRKNKIKFKILIIIKITMNFKQ